MRINTIAFGALMLCISCGLSFSSPYRSPSSICSSPDGSQLYVGEKTARQVARISPKSGKVDMRYPLPSQPNGLALSKDGKTLYVTVEEPDGRIYVIDTESGDTLKEIKTGHTPMAPTLSPTKKRFISATSSKTMFPSST